MPKKPDLKMLKKQLKSERDPLKQKKLQMEIKREEKDRLRRLKDFEKMVQKPKADMKKLEHILRNEPDREIARKMDIALEKGHRLHQKAGAGPATTAAATPKYDAKRPSRSNSAEDKKEAKKRLVKFDSVLKRDPSDIKQLEKLAKSEEDPVIKRTMMQKIKKAAADFKKQAASESVVAPTAASHSDSTSGVFAGRGSQSAVQTKAAKDRMKKFEIQAKSRPEDIMALRKLMKTESDKRNRADMERLIKKLEAEAKRHQAAASSSLRGRAHLLHRGDQETGKLLKKVKPEKKG